jgi:hypothetical protein
MGRYDAHKNPFTYRINQHSQRKTLNRQEQQAKSIPCHVVKVEKDFIHVAFETRNSIFTPPVMKMSQNFSRFGREPTQVGDKGLAAPGHYYTGGNTAFSGGGTNFYQRSNLSTLAFQPLANLNAPKRDYDQHHETGGPKGWKVRTMEKQQEKQGTGGTTGSTGLSGFGSQAQAVLTRTNARVMGQRNFTHPRVVAATNGSSGTSTNGSGNGQQSQQQKDADEQEKSKTELSFDKDGKVLLQSVDEDNYLYVDQKNTTIQSQSKNKNIHQSEKPEHSVMCDKDHAHIRFEDNRIWVDKTGCYSSKPIQVKQDPYDH